MKRKGFTLIELLVVIAIIGLLLAILVPSLQNAKKLAAGVVCLANLRGLSLCFYQYAENNDGKIVRCNQGPDRWVDAPHTVDASGNRSYTDHNSTIEEKENGNMGGLIAEYASSPKLFHCPADRRFKVRVGSRGVGPYRSYAMPESLGQMNENARINLSGDSGTKTIFPVISYSDLVNPSGKYIFVEENYTHSPNTSATAAPDMGFNGGVWSFWRGDNIDSWWDPLAPWHNDRTNLGFADGHGEKLVWKDKRTVWYSFDRMDPRLGSGRDACALQVGNPDLQYMTRAYPTGK